MAPGSSVTQGDVAVDGDVDSVVAPLAATFDATLAPTFDATLSVVPVVPAVAPPVAPPLRGHHAGHTDDAPHWTGIVALIAGALYVLGALINAAVTVVSPGAYAALGDWWGAPEPLNRLWQAALGDHARLWLPLVGVVLQLLLGLLCLSRDRRRRALGLSGAAAFHAGLLAMGMWAWALPMLALLGRAAVLTWRAPERANPVA